MSDIKTIDMDTILDPKRRNPYESTPDTVSTSDSDMDYKIMKEASLESFRKNYFKDTKSFKAIVLRVGGDTSAVRRRTSLVATGEDTSDYIEVHARIPTLHPMIPKPRMVPPRPEDADKDKGIIEMHPVFIARKQGELSNIEPGDIVLVEFNKGPGDGVQSEGRIIKIYQKAKVVRSEDGTMRPGDYQRVFTSAGAEAEQVTLGSFQGEHSSGGEPLTTDETATSDLNWDTLGQIVDSGALIQILNFLGDKESRTNRYNAVNRGRAGDSPRQARDYILRNPKNLTEMSILEAGSYQKGRNQSTLVDMTPAPGRLRPSSRPGFLAIGRYQIVPDTLQEAVIRSGTPGGALFNENSQDRLCADLLLSYKRGLSNFLLGKSDNSADAGQDLALIWASLPLQYTRQSNGNVRGQSAYANDEAGNRSSTSTTPEEIINILRYTRELLTPVLARLNMDMTNTEEDVPASLARLSEEEGPIEAPSSFVIY